MVAAVVGGGVKLLGAEVPVLGSFPRQALLFALGLAFLLGSFQISQTKPTKPNSPTPSPAQSGSAGQGASGGSTMPQTGGAIILPEPSVNSAGCPQATALSCLPKSSGAVTFANPTAANLAAEGNIKSGLSTSQAQAEAMNQGASGKAARLCGIVASNDSSPLGKHLAAVRLNNPLPTDGHASGACRALADNFL